MVYLIHVVIDINIKFNIFFFFFFKLNSNNGNRHRSKNPFLIKITKTTKTTTEDKHRKPKSSRKSERFMKQHSEATPTHFKEKSHLDENTNKIIEQIVHDFEQSRLINDININDTKKKRKLSG